MMKISVVYICVFSLQLRKIKRIHGCIVSSTHKKRFGCFQDKNEEENNNAISQIMNERRIFLENFPSEALYQNAKGLLALAYQLKYKKHKSEFVNVSTDSIIITLDC